MVSVCLTIGPMPTNVVLAYYVFLLFPVLTLVCMCACVCVGVWADKFQGV